MIHWMCLHLLMGFHNPKLSLLHASDLVDLLTATATSWAASGDRAREQLGFAPAAVLDTRLRETADWLREHKRL